MKRYAGEEPRAASLSADRPQIERRRDAVGNRESLRGRPKPIVNEPQAALLLQAPDSVAIEIEKIYAKTPPKLDDTVDT